MRNSLKNAIKDFLPPILTRLRGGGKNQKVLIFSGNYKTWDEAKSRSAGYESGVILEKVKTAAEKVKRGDAAFERDGVAFREPDYRWPLIASLLFAASLQKNRLSVMDFGGSLGSAFFQNRKLLSHLELLWSVVEQKPFAEEGAKRFSDRTLRFFDSIEEAASLSPNLALFGSSLPYVPKPYEILAKITSLPVRYLVVDRTPFIKDGDDRLTVQTVPAKFGGGSYPAWFFSEKKFLNFFSPAYELVAEFKALEGTVAFDGIVATYKGFLFKKND